MDQTPWTQGFTCLVTLKVANDGGREVQLGTLRVPVSGNQGGAAFHVTGLGDGAAPADDGSAAVTDLDRSLEPGEEELVTIGVQFRESGCTARGSQ